LVLDWLSQMTITKYKIKVINETILNDVSKNEAEQIAEMLEMRNSIPTFLGNISYTYSEIEQLN
jgi:hypothetical protein